MQKNHPEAIIFSHDQQFEEFNTKQDFNKPDNFAALTNHFVNRKAYIGWDLCYGINLTEKIWYRIEFQKLKEALYERRSNRKLYKTLS